MTPMQRLTDGNGLLVCARLQMKIVCAILATVGLLWSGLRAQAELADAIQAIVHDSVITVQEVQNLAAPAVDVLRDESRTSPESFQRKLTDVLTNSMEQLVQRQLILHEFQTAGYSLPESILEDEVQQRIRSRYGNRATLTKTLQAQGVTYEKFRQQVRDQIIVEALRAKNISSEILISPHKIEAYYLANKDKYKLEDQVKLRMISLNKSNPDDKQTREMADEILAKIKDGATFSEMAGVYSQGSQRSQAGDWGWVERSVLRKELADVAFSLKVGETSGVIETSDACYLMLVEQSRLAHVRPLSEVRDEIEKTLTIEERGRLQKQWIDRLKKKTFVRYF